MRQPADPRGSHRGPTATLAANGRIGGDTPSPDRCILARAAGIASRPAPVPDAGRGAIAGSNPSFAEAEAADGLGVPARGRLPDAARHTGVGHLGGPEWERVCSCRREVWRAPDGRLDPNSAHAEPHQSAHRHSPSCEGTHLAQVVKVERYIDGGWRSECLLCRTVQLYWWNPVVRAHAERADAAITQVDGSHVIMISKHPPAR
jgi:hypothetical protein